ncbi:N-acetyltransferase O1 (Establishment of cohesion protein 1) [Xylographa opegraphella]|nr:N-acetyltransferase O1 (Establishment of cohesion protein 1) [Xylographa opegraphella]
MADKFIYRGILKTYARQPRRTLDYQDSESHRRTIRMDDSGFVHEISASVRDASPPAERDATSSSAASEGNDGLSSDPPRQSTATPPSSPPPRVTSPREDTIKLAFLSHKRKRSAVSKKASPPDALTELPPSSTNARKGPPPAKKVRLTQMQIDLGGEIRRACKECGMDYIPSNAEDAALHKEFHSINIGGVDMGKGFARDVTVVGRAGEGEIVAIVEAKSALGLRNKVKKVLGIVNKELGAVDVEEGILWEKMAVATRDNKKRRTEKRRGLRAGREEEEKEERFKVFLYLAGDKCIGLCLAERIHNASKVIASEEHDASEHSASVGVKSSSISTETARDAALLGISRIWTSKSHRRKGIASALLDCARGNFFYGIEVPKEMVAFSQPTESGGRLAQRWFGEESGWHVYAKNQCVD